MTAKPNVTCIQRLRYTLFGRYSHSWQGDEINGVVRFDPLLFALTCFRYSMDETYTFVEVERIRSFMQRVYELLTTPEEPEAFSPPSTPRKLPFDEDDEIEWFLPPVSDLVGQNMDCS